MENKSKEQGENLTFLISFSPVLSYYLI